VAREAKYNPEIHHRRSIRLKGHDYSGGGLYFVTICAHREFCAWAGVSPFGVGARPALPNDQRARQASPVRKIIEERMRITAEKEPCMHWEETVVMPDHFHALVCIEGGGNSLGNVIGGFKSAVTREVHRRVHSIPANIRIWHRNYYEMIVRSREEQENIANYIQMNPWKCVMDFGNGLKGMGNPTLWNKEKVGVLCSRGAPKPKNIPNAEVYLGGFHSPMEKQILEKLLELKKSVIYCPAWRLDNVVGETALPNTERARQASPVREALEENRMLILEMQNQDGNLAAAEQRNRFVIEKSDNLWVPFVKKGGMLERLLNV
jgi:putative transposase